MVLLLVVSVVFGYMHSVLVHCTCKCRKANAIQKAHSNIIFLISTIIVPCKLAHLQCKVILRKKRLEQSEISQTKEGTLLFFVYRQEVGIMVASTYNNHL
jgi:hypothetical protein